VGTVLNLAMTKSVAQCMLIIDDYLTPLMACYFYNDWNSTFSVSVQAEIVSHQWYQALASNGGLHLFVQHCWL